MRGTFTGIVAIDHALAGSSGARYLDADLVHAPAAPLSLMALYPFELAGLVITLWYKLRRSAWTKGARSSHGCLRQLFATCQLADDAFPTAGCLAATFSQRLTLEVILAAWRSCGTHVLLLEGWASTYRLQRWLCNIYVFWRKVISLQLKYLIILC